MAYKLIWSQAAIDDLRDLVQYIAWDNQEAAARFGINLITRVETLQQFPEIGRVVPERRDPLMRELIVTPYRVVYRLNQQSRLIEIIRVWHGSRGKPEGV